ncbi:Phosphoenolpyruvate/pyruvate domain-containing protein [Penicillium herquei]|nr:Phosphoenolpyruvate/pyruvate domain-containing protein [Penicillium herquei]
MGFPTSMQKSLAQPSTAFGFWLTLPSAAVAKTILHGTEPSTNFSWVLIDAEHGLISDHHYYELNNAIASEGASPIIRIPCAEEWMIKRALDAGAHGIMTPMCHTELLTEAECDLKEDAINVVKYCRYPPLGTRGYGPMWAPHTFSGVAGSDYDEGIQSGLTVAVQIESRAGVENIEKIASVDGVNLLFIGPFNLSKQMNVTRGGEEHEAAIQRVLTAAHFAGKKATIFCTDGDDARQRVSQGFDMVSVNTDVGGLKGGMLGHLQKAKSS